MLQFSLFFLKFILFSMIGYIVEMVECAIDEGRWNNRGFLCGPILPIFGIGSMALIYLLEPFSYNPILIFVLGILITTSLEYFGGWFIEKTFKNKWWDYSKERFNLQGRICLKNSLLFGVGTLLIIYVANPYISNFLIEIKDSVLITLTVIIGIIFLLDTIYSSVVAYRLRNHIIIVEDLKNQKLSKIPGMFEKMLTKELKGKKALPKRVMKAFPSLFKKYQKEFELIHRIEEKLNFMKKKQHNKRKEKKKKILK